MRSIILLLAISAALWSQTPNRGYYRSPAIYGQTIFFTAVNRAAVRLRPSGVRRAIDGVMAVLLVKKC